VGEESGSSARSPQPKMAALEIEKSGTDTGGSSALPPPSAEAPRGRWGARLEITGGTAFAFRWSSTGHYCCCCCHGDRPTVTVWAPLMGPPKSPTPPPAPVLAPKNPVGETFSQAVASSRAECGVATETLRAALRLRWWARNTILSPNCRCHKDLLPKFSDTVRGDKAPNGCCSPLWQFRSLGYCTQD